MVVNGGFDRADGLAGRRLAMHAGHGLEDRPRRGLASVVVDVDPEPVHVAAPRDLVRADHRHVILGLAGDDAGVAADATPRVDHHAPGVGIAGRGRPGRIEARPRRRRGDLRADVDFRRELTGLAFKREQTRGGRRQPPVSADFPDGHAAQDPGQIRALKGSRVETDAVADGAGARSAVTERQRNDAGRCAIRKAHRAKDRSAAFGDRDLVAFLDAEIFRVNRRHLDGVPPYRLRERLRTLLQPGVVGETPVEDGRIDAEDRRHAAAGKRSGRRPAGELRRWFGDGRRGGSGDDAVDQRRAPARVEILLAPARAPGRANAVIVALIGLAGEDCEEPVRAEDPCSGRISGWTMLTTPSVAAVSDQLSSGCGAGRCHVEAAAVSSK